MVALDHRDIAAAWRRAHTALEAVSRPLKRLLRRAAASALPGSLLASKPPDEPESGGILFFFEESRSLGRKERLVREIAPPFSSSEESLAELVIGRQSGFL